MRLGTTRQSGALEISIAGGDTGASLNLRKRVAWVERWVGPLAGRRLLDCGCGAGAYARAYAERGAHVVGVEHSADKLRVARTTSPELTFVRADICQLPLSAASFDVVVFNEVLEHVPDDDLALREASRVLAPDGWLLVMSPNRLYPFESHGVTLKGLGTKLPAHTPFVPYVPLPLGKLVFDYWARNYWPWQLRAQVRRAGFEIVRSGYVAQTLENISGTQPPLLRALAPSLRRLLETLEQAPLVAAWAGVSQVIAARPRKATW